VGQVTKWQMTEEERLAYIEKYPIKPTKNERPVSFKTDYPDYKWRVDKGAIASKIAREK
jgi:hypothetical protein